MKYEENEVNIKDKLLPKELLNDEKKIQFSTLWLHEIIALKLKEYELQKNLKEEKFQVTEIVYKHGSFVKNVIKKFKRNLEQC